MLTKERARHILQLSQEEKKDFLESFDLVLSDCDGVLWMVSKLLPNTGDAINLLKKSGKTYKFISNNSMRTDDEYVERFKEIGAKDVTASDIVHPLKTIIAYLKMDDRYKKVFTIAGKEFNNGLVQAGFEVVEFEEEDYWTAANLIEKLPIEEPVQAVIFDIDYNMSMAKLCRAQQYLNNQGCDFIVGASDKFIPMAKNFNIIGPAGLIDVLFKATGKEPLFLGKPGEKLGQFLIEHFNIDTPKRALFIGDALVQDIQFGITTGFQTLFVLSGACTKEEMLSCPEELRPHYYADGMADFLEFFKAL